jgi:hypothetical protein
MVTTQHLSLENMMSRYYLISTFYALVQYDGIVTNTNLLTIGKGSVGYMECKEGNAQGRG